MKSTQLTVPLPSISASTTSIYDLKTAYTTSTSIPSSKIKILYKKKPVADSKTVAEVIGQDTASEVEFSVMVMGSAVAGATPAATPPAVAPSEDENELAGVGETVGSVAQGPSGKEVVASDVFWEDLRGFVVQRIKDEKEGGRLIAVFRKAWDADQ